MEQSHWCSFTIVAQFKRTVLTVRLTNMDTSTCISVSNAALQTCLYQHTQHAIPLKGFTSSEEDLPSLRELRLVAMHMPEWEEVGKALLVDKGYLDQCRKSNRYS